MDDEKHTKMMQTCFFFNRLVTSQKDKEQKAKKNSSRKKHINSMDTGVYHTALQHCKTFLICFCFATTGKRLTTQQSFTHRASTGPFDRASGGHCVYL